MCPRASPQSSVRECRSLTSCRCWDFLRKAGRRAPVSQGVSSYGGPNQHFQGLARTTSSGLHYLKTSLRFCNVAIASCCFYLVLDFFNFADGANISRNLRLLVYIVYAVGPDCRCRGGQDSEERYGWRFAGQQLRQGLMDSLRLEGSCPKIRSRRL